MILLSRLNDVRVYDWTADLAIIASNELDSVHHVGFTLPKFEINTGISFAAFFPLLFELPRQVVELKPQL